jgi:HAT1-interacting factor 1
LRKFEQAVEHYATALELLSKTHAEDAPEMADVYFAYGKALLENAIAQNSVLGKEQEGAPAAEEPAPNGNKILSFSGDAEDEGEGENDDPAVDLFAEVSKLDAEGEGEGEEGAGDGGADEAEPEDDFNAAWEVLDLARAIYEKQMDGDDEMRLKAADTFIMLGDISLETEKFDQAITDYSSGLALKTELLPLSSRHLAEAHYKLSIALDLTAGRLADAIHHAQRALESIEARLVELQAGLAGTLPPLPKPEPSDTNGKGKGKGKGTQVTLAQDELVQNRSKAQIEAEIKELGELKQDLALKVDELKVAPNDERDGGLSAPELAQRALDRELNTAPPTRQELPVNDLTSMVVKKKKKAPAAPEASGAAEKRKAEYGEEAQKLQDKKARLEESPAAP